MNKFKPFAKQDIIDIVNKHNNCSIKVKLDDSVTTYPIPIKHITVTLSHPATTALHNELVNMFELNGCSLFNNTRTSYIFTPNR